MIVGIGTDLLDFRRLQVVVERSGKRFLTKIFTEQERRYCDARQSNPFATYGSTFAAKEAVLKAIGHTNGVRWHDIEIVRQSNGAPTVQLHGAALQNCMAKVGSANFAVHLTLTDEPPQAMAFVVLEKL